MIRIWRGFHSDQLLGLIRNAWEREELLVLCPPHLKDLSFVDLLPEGLLETVGDWSDAPSGLPVLPRAGTCDYPDKPVLGVFTSGTLSGVPRLVLYSKRNLEFSLNGIRSFFDTRRFDTIFSYPQPFHTFGLVLAYVHAALYDLRLVTAPGRYSRAAHELRAELREESLLTLGTPTHFHDLLSYVDERGLELVPSYSCILGGAKVSVSLWNAIRDRLRISAPSIGYGATEASPGVTHQPPGLAPLEEGEIGHPIPGVHLNYDAIGGAEFKGPNVCLAILESGKVHFPKSVCLRDRLKEREDGIWVYEGRMDLMLNRGGQKFSLERIEEIVSHAAGTEAVCVRLSDERLGEDLGILLRTRQGRVSLQERKRWIAALLQEEFGQSFKSAKLTEVDQLPVNESAKVDRKRTEQLLLNDWGLLGS